MCSESRVGIFGRSTSAYRVGGGEQTWKKGYIQNYRAANEEFLCRRVLLSIVDLFPERQVIIGTGMLFWREGNASGPVEH